jgi:hypothetical protein
LLIEHSRRSYLNCSVHFAKSLFVRPLGGAASGQSSSSADGGARTTV